jgi:hypothetical protein
MILIACIKRTVHTKEHLQNIEGIYDTYSVHEKNEL